jgi:hypothetical protein
MDRNREQKEKERQNMSSILISVKDQGKQV